MSQYSPISWRSTRASALSWRRRDSLSSSAGASSVRRLIAAVRSTPAGPRPPKKALLRHCAALLLGHLSWAAAVLPFFPLQSGFGAFEPRLGPLLPALLFGVAALASCIAPIITHKLGCNVVISLGHVITMLFVGAHFYPR
ncbi:hypothetical protein QAD02_018713 [Eretmocerus hayati]|uniref:Uncharacterized protein n=1 Tax=Eretmocerus hayati TaxID=131215 RepID=A0ACC2PIR8_9HYME|nr:hypothetical protein QAD02_018713 [Eretmocerus hayati]